MHTDPGRPGIVFKTFFFFLLLSFFMPLGKIEDRKEIGAWGKAKER